MSILNCLQLKPIIKLQQLSGYIPAIELIYVSILSTNLLDNFLFNFKLKSFRLWQNPLI